MLYQQLHYMNDVLLKSKEKVYAEGEVHSFLKIVADHGDSIFVFIEQWQIEQLAELEQLVRAEIDDINRRAQIIEDHLRVSKSFKILEPALLNLKGMLKQNLVMYAISQVL